jgi:hypothetical protein
MSWKIRFLENPPLHGPDPESRHYDGTVDFSKLQIGDLCFYHYKGKPCDDREVLNRLNLTAHYFAHNVGRPPLILALPDKPTGSIYFMVDGQCYSGKCSKCGKGMTKHTWRNDDQLCANGQDIYSPRGYHDGWTVSGTPPAIAVSPSINYDDDETGIKHYHGFVQNGVIGDG